MGCPDACFDNTGTAAAKPKQSEEAFWPYLTIIAASSNWPGLLLCTKSAGTNQISDVVTCHRTAVSKWLLVLGSLCKPDLCLTGCSLLLGLAGFARLPGNFVLGLPDLVPTAELNRWWKLGTAVLATGLWQISLQGQRLLPLTDSPNQLGCNLPAMRKLPL